MFRKSLKLIKNLVRCLLDQSACSVFGQTTRGCTHRHRQLIVKNFYLQQLKTELKKNFTVCFLSWNVMKMKKSCSESVNTADTHSHPHEVQILDRAMVLLSLWRRNWCLSDIISLCFGNKRRLMISSLMLLVADVWCIHRPPPAPNQNFL